MLDSGGKIVTSQLTIPSQSFYLRAAVCCVLRSKLSNVASKASNIASKASNVSSVALNIVFNAVQKQGKQIEKKKSIGSKDTQV